MANIASKTMVSAAAKILSSKSTSKDEKLVASSALSQTQLGTHVSRTVASRASRILLDPKASRDAKTVAASALIQWPAKPSKHADKIRNAIVQMLKPV